MDLPDSQTNPPEHILRCILIFGRSKEIPMISTREIPFLKNPCCFLDILYIHLKISEGGGELCQQTFDVLSQLPDTESSNPFIFETHNSTIKLNTYMAVLMAHPVQRDADFLLRTDVTKASLDELRAMMGAGSGSSSSTSR